LLKQFPYDISELTLIPSKGGRFEVVVDGALVYSKLATGRHAASGEIEGLIDALRQ
jgi:selenoprotein W-related protein